MAAPVFRQIADKIHASTGHFIKRMEGGFAQTDNVELPRYNKGYKDELVYLMEELKEYETRLTKTPLRSSLSLFKEKAG